VELLRGRGVPLSETTLQPLAPFVDTFSASDNNIIARQKGHNDDTEQDTPSLSNTLQLMQQLAVNERELLEAGSTAFMSFLRAYKEHLCSYIFRLETLSIGAVARSYGLLRLPKIPETRGVRGRPIDFVTVAVDTSSIPYRHREKEQARLRRQTAFREEKLVCQQ